MKVYVDKLPKSCQECNLRATTYYPAYNMTLYSCDIDHHPRNIENADEMTKFPCPLQTLAEHDKKKDERIQELEKIVHNLLGDRQLLSDENKILHERLKNAIVCPCKVGDTVFAVRGTKYGWNSKKFWIEKCVVKEIGWDKKSVYIIAGITRSNLTNFGKNIFFTELEAQNRLKELEKGAG